MAFWRRGNEAPKSYGADAEDLRFNLEVRELTKSFGNGPDVLRGLNLRFPTKKITTVLGPSGSGKTVLIKHLVGLIEPDDGEIWVGGTNLWTLSVHKRRQGSESASTHNVA